jgi:putative thiamine transport system substrate-binding protein
VLAVSRLPSAQRALFQGGVKPGQLTQAAPVLPEPHASWVDKIEKEWIRRYAR